MRLNDFNPATTLGRNVVQPFFAHDINNHIKGNFFVIFYMSIDCGGLIDRYK